MAKTKKSKTDRQTETIRALRARIKELEADRDKYRQWLHQVLPVKRYRFTRKELKEMEAYRPTFTEFVAQLEAEVKAQKQNGR